MQIANGQWRDQIKPGNIYLMGIVSLQMCNNDKSQTFELRSPAYTSRYLDGSLMSVVKCSVGY